jgi:hypothetical protein
MRVKIYGGYALRIVIGIVVTISFMVGVVNATPASGWWDGSHWDLKFLVSESGDSIESYTITVPCSVPWPPYMQYRAGGPIPIIDNTFKDGNLMGTFSDTTNEASGSYLSGSGCFNLISWSATLESIVTPTPEVTPTPTPEVIPTPTPEVSPTPVPVPIPPPPVPEFSTIVLVSAGMLGMFLVAGRYNKRK